MAERPFYWFQPAADWDNPSHDWEDRANIALTFLNVRGVLSDAETRCARERLRKQLAKELEEAGG